MQDVSNCRPRPPSGGEGSSTRRLGGAVLLHIRVPSAKTPGEAGDDPAAVHCRAVVWI